ncbi:MAG: 50S ribosomal protein L11 methyltransferase [Firmicutes bacterium]|nr:50S ribosomal protein L11 methyltransferase [Bacillota bacterium]MDY4959717.1 50S ribosomal protein L11 methyltransferase [Lentihominibacter sp.]
MKYTAFEVRGTSAGLEMITAIMMNHGIDYISIDDPEDMEDILNKKNEYGWDYIDDELKENLDREPVLSVYFDEEQDLNIIDVLKADIEKLKQDVAEGAYGESFDGGSLEVTVSVSDDSQWKDKWKEFFHPSRITERLVVKPSWEEYRAEPDDLVIEIDPGMAFGTGTHETTSLCMKLMEKYFGEFGENVKVLDVGCGSGILSIAASLLGAGEVLGVEIDKDAVQVARENVQLNKCDDNVRVIEGDLTKGIDFKGDIIVANLMADLVMMLSKSAREHLEDGGIFISSGILADKEKVVSEAITDAGFTIEEVMVDGEWCAIAARG